MVRPLLSLLWIGLAALLTSCSHYRLGTGAERDFETLFVPPIQTESLLPQATALLSTQIRESFARDGRVRLVNSPAEADAVLTVRLDTFRRDGQAALPADSGLSRVFNLELTAKATLASPHDGKVWFADRTLIIDRRVFTDDGSDPASDSFLQPVQQTQAEYNTLPIIGENLAHQLVQTVLDTW